MLKKKVHMLALSHNTFVGFLALWVSIMWLFDPWIFFGSSPRKPRAKPYALGQIRNPYKSLNPNNSFRICLSDTTLTFGTHKPKLISRIWSIKPDYIIQKTYL